LVIKRSDPLEEHKDRRIREIQQRFVDKKHKKKGKN